MDWAVHCGRTRSRVWCSGDPGPPGRHQEEGGIPHATKGGRSRRPPCARLGFGRGVEGANGLATEGIQDVSYQEHNWGQTTPWNNLDRWEETRSHTNCTASHAQRRDGFQLGWVILGSTSSPDPCRKPEAWQFIYHGKPGERPHANIYIIPYNISESKWRATRAPAVSLVIRSLLNVPSPSISTIGRRRLLTSWSREEMKEGSELWRTTEKIGDSAGRQRLPAVELSRFSK